MRDIKYNLPYPVRHTSRITLDIIVSEMKTFIHANEKEKNYFEKSYAVFTCYGIVVMYEFNWTTNKGRNIFTYLRTMIGNIVYSAFVSDAKFNDTQAHWLATHFIKNIITKSTQL